MKESHLERQEWSNHGTDQWDEGRESQANSCFVLSYSGNGRPASRFLHALPVLACRATVPMNRVRGWIFIYMQDERRNASGHDTVPETKGAGASARLAPRSRAQAPAPRIDGWRSEPRQASTRSCSLAAADDLVKNLSRFDRWQAKKPYYYYSKYSGMPKIKSKKFNNQVLNITTNILFLCGFVMHSGE